MTKYNNSLIKNSIVISVLVSITKVLGFVKQAVVAWAFGSNGGTDVFFAADGFTAMIGQIMNQSIGPTVVTQYINEREKKGVYEANNLINASMLFFFIISILIAFVCALFSNQICNLIGVSYSKVQLVELNKILLLLCPVIVISAVTGVCSGYLDACKCFVPNRLCSLFFSVCIIISVVFFHNRCGIWSLVIGFMCGYFLHLVNMLYNTYKKIDIIFVSPFNNESFYFLLKRFSHMVIGISVIDLCGLVDRVVASSLESGSVSILYYGQVVSSDIVFAVLISAIGTVLLTHFSKQIVNTNCSNEIINDIRDVLKLTIMIMMLITTLYIVSGEDLIKLFFERGRFVSSDTKLVYFVALGYSVGFVFMGIREILIKVHYAFYDTFSPMLNGILGVIVNITATILLAKKYGVLGISLATSMSIVVVSIMSIFTLRKHIGCCIVNKNIIYNSIKVLFSCIISVFLCYILRDYYSSQFLIVRFLMLSAIDVILFFLLNILLKEEASMVIKKYIFKNL